MMSSVWKAVAVGALLLVVASPSLATNEEGRAFLREEQQQEQGLACPEPGAKAVPLSAPVEGTLNLSKSATNTLCTLLWTNGQDKVIPLARSFGGLEWERYASALAPDLPSIHCNTEACQVPVAQHHAAVDKNASEEEDEEWFYALVGTKHLESGGDEQQEVKGTAQMNMEGTHENVEHHQTSTERRLEVDLNCPKVGDALSIAPGTYDLKIARRNALCMLSITDGVEIIPVARTYESHDWERYLQLGKLSLNVDFECSQRRCLITLPQPDPGFNYMIMSSKHDMSKEDEIARFLEQATFGVTRQAIQEIDSIGGTNNPITKMAKWIKDQQDPVVTPPTSHREYFRLRANDRFESSSGYGITTTPCQVNAMYRKFAFTLKHDNKFVQIYSHPNGTKKVLSIEGEIMTVVDGPVMHDIDGTAPKELLDGSYEICYRPFPGVGGKLMLSSGGLCHPVSFGAIRGNPPIDFPEDMIPEELVNLTSVAPMDSDYFAQYFEDSTQIIRSDVEITDPVCDTINVGLGKIPFVFGMYEGEYWIHDPRFAFHENTVDSPMPDGGGSIVEATENAGFPLGAFCASAPRTYLNEDKCSLSSEPTACGFETFQYITGLEGQYGKGMVTCGSPNEIANDPTLGGWALHGAFDAITAVNRTSSSALFLEQRSMIWASISVWAKDQLRQRVAFALSQIFVVNFSVSGNAVTEDWMNLYDIYVRNAFGNYRDIIKEIAYSPMMGEMLTYMNSKSMGWEWLFNQALVHHADENFARELMQLFSIGLYELNQDGSRKLDENGNFLRTYSNDDIMEYARAWTGFQGQPRRGNSAASQSNRIDPMKIDPRLRDQFPKMGLYGQHVGDGYPLCRDLPKHHYLKKGAKYRLMGYSPQVELGIIDPDRWADSSNQVRFEADPSGQLYQALCDPDTNGDCRFPAVVNLEENLQCAGDECNTEMDSIRNVKVFDEVFYEYIQPACVYQPFYANPRKVKSRYSNSFMCADPLTEVASATCCLEQGASYDSQQKDVYWGERLKAATAEARCARLGATDSRLAMCTSTGKTFKLRGTQPDVAAHFWWSSQSECFVKAKVDRYGKVAVTHDVPDEAYKSKRTLVDENTKTFFRVHWSDNDEAQTLLETCESYPDCSLSSDGYCMCDTTTTEESVFSAMPTKDQVLADLHIGAFDQEIYDGEYQHVTSADGEVSAYLLGGTFDKNTIFEVIDTSGMLSRRTNIRFTTQLVGTNLTFRTPPQFHAIVEETQRDSMYETEAVIDQVFRHSNTAPFVALIFSQRFGISNPTPRYLQTIADAFRTGTYIYDGSDTQMTFGDGRYGSMEATVAATLLDRESRSLLLDSDPAHGQMREPLLKVTGIFRGLELQRPTDFPQPRFYKRLEHAIGQMVFAAPDVFSFFLKEHQPDGAVAGAGLVSPESQLHTGPNLISMMNGIFGTIKYGLDRCFGGFGWPVNYFGEDSCELREIGHYENSSGYFGYVPVETRTEKIVEELATVMTAGRLSEENRAIITDVVKSENNGTLAVIKAQQLISASSEFHASGVVGKTGASRTPNPPPPASTKPYKALIMVLLPGGADTWNFVMPHTCSGMNQANQTVEEQYTAARGKVAIKLKDRNQIVEPHDDSQPCSKFSLHKRLSVLRYLYSIGDLSLFMNVGVMNSANVTKDNYEAKTRTQLFAHNDMQQENQQVDPFDVEVRTGLLGRLVKVLNNDYGFSSAAFSVDTLATAVFGDVKDKVSPPPSVVGSRGVDRFDQHPESETYDPMPLIQAINGENDISSNLFGETFSDKFTRAIHESEMLADELDGVKLTYVGGDEGLNTVTKMMATHEARGVDRDVFFLKIGSWDHHFSLAQNLDAQMIALNDAVDKFRRNVPRLGLWDNVAMVATSDFGRTLTPNTHLGTDHGWAGHYFAVGGALNGGKIHGTYPSDITDSGPLSLERGRIIPTMSLEEMWAPFMEWMGVAPEDMDKVLPNLQNLDPSASRPAHEDLFGL